MSSHACSLVFKKMRQEGFCEFQVNLEYKTIRQAIRLCPKNNNENENKRNQTTSLNQT